MIDWNMRTTVQAHIKQDKTKGRGVSGTCQASLALDSLECATMTQHLRNAAVCGTGGAGAAGAEALLAAGAAARPGSRRAQALP